MAGALSPTTAKAIAGAASAAKSSSTPSKSSGVSTASKSGGSAKDAGSPKQVTPKVTSATKGTGAVSKVSSTTSKGADASDIYGSSTSSSKKSTVAKASSSGASASKSPTTKVVQTTTVPGFTADTAAETRAEQTKAANIAALENAAREAMLNPSSGMPLAGSIGGGVDALVDLAQNIASPTSTLNSPALQQRIAENGGVAPFEGVVDWAGIQAALTPKTYNEITIPGKGTATYDKVSDQPLSWGMMLDLLGSPETASQYLSSGSPNRLPAEPAIRTAQLPAFTPDSAYVGRTIDPNGDYSAPLGAIAAADRSSIPAAERWGWKSPFAGMASTITQALGYDPKTPGAIDLNMGDVPAPPGIDAAAEPSTWDNVVDNTGKLLSHTGLGGIVSTLFPDMWGGIGSAIKNIGGVETKYPDEMAVAMDDIYGERSQMKRDQEARARVPDLNHNGVDDRKEGYTGPDTRPKPGTTLPPTRSEDIPPIVTGASPTRTVQFPVMPPYDPGRSPEFMYFLNNHLANGGVVSAPAYAEGGAIDQSDPKVQLIGATEDVLEKIKGGAKPDEQDAKILKAFVAQFGDAALKSLNDNVGEGLSMKSAGSGKGRQIKGPGGPKDDAVPAVIVEEGSVVSPAKLSNGEFVFSVDAVKGIGEGDIEVGAQRLQELSERLTQKGAA